MAALEHPASAAQLQVLGLDIGGANLKAAHSAGPACLRPFALWRAPEQLAAELSQLLADFPVWDLLAVTMTGELCDCFCDRRQGVHHILAAVAQVAAGRPVWVWRHAGWESASTAAPTWALGHFVNPETALSTPYRVASQNWLALAHFAGRWAPEGPALLLDIGSTTTDIIPLLNGKPVARGRTDASRLRWGELVYTGVQRTPVCALAGGRLAAEVFATMGDVYLLLGQVPEAPSRCDTADSRPATRFWAHARLARMQGRDGNRTPAALTQALARRLAHRQRQWIGRALAGVCRRLPGPPQTVVLSGTGEFLARQVVVEYLQPAPRLVSLTAELGPERSAAACAYAVARLAQENYPRKLPQT
jgi:probable H4MPT-linked C1 transfer pathway protein